jgi:YbbR domain-containing protein
VLLSVFLWFYVLNSQKISFEKTVLVEYILPDDLIFAEKPITEAVFMLEGPQSFVRLILEREEKIFIDVNKLNPNKLMDLSVELKSSQLKLPLGIVVHKILPNKIQLRFDKKVSKILPLRPYLIGALPKEIFIKNMQVSPKDVEVFGPASVLANLNELQTKPIPVENLLGMSEFPLEPKLIDQRLSIAPNLDLKLTYDMKAMGPNLVLDNLPIRFLNKNKNYQGQPQVATLKLFVPDNIKDRLNISSSVQVWAELPEDEKGRVEIPLKGIVPMGVHLIEISPKSIIVNVQ